MLLSADEEAQRVLFSPYKTTEHSKGAPMDTHRPTDTQSCVHAEEPTELTPTFTEQDIQQCKALYNPLNPNQTKKQPICNA